MKDNDKKLDARVYYHNAVDMLDMLMTQACRFNASKEMYNALKEARMQANREIIKEFGVENGR